MAIGGYLPLKMSDNFEPVLEELQGDEVDHILGAQGQLWSEYMKSLEHVEYMAFPHACTLAEMVWLAPKQKDFASFSERIQPQAACSIVLAYMRSFDFFFDTSTVV